MNGIDRLSSARLRGRRRIRPLALLAGVVLLGLKDMCSPPTLAETFRVRTKPAAFGAATPPLTFPPADGSPVFLPATALAAANQAPLDADLTWQDHSYREDGYAIERSSDSGVTWSIVATVPDGIRHYLDQSLSGGTSYLYRVRPFVGSSFGPPSNETSLVSPADEDEDGLADNMEAAFGSDPSLRSTAGDEVPDGWRYRYQFPPTVAFPPTQDTESDSVPDIWEYRLSSHPREADGNLDFDGDGLPNSWELANGLDPKSATPSADSDTDGLNDADEFRYGSDPLDQDSDDDGVNDGPDGWPMHPGLAPPRLPGITRYAVVPIDPTVYPIAMNNVCEVVGAAKHWKNGITTVLTPLPLPPGTTPHSPPQEFEAHDINDAGVIVGMSEFTWPRELPGGRKWTPAWDYHAVYWANATAIPVDLGDLTSNQPAPGGVADPRGKLFSAADAINNSGLIAGRSAFDAFLFGEAMALARTTHAFTGDANGLTDNVDLYVSRYWDEGRDNEFPVWTNEVKLGASGSLLTWSYSSRKPLPPRALAQLKTPGSSGVTTFEFGSSITWGGLNANNVLVGSEYSSDNATAFVWGNGHQRTFFRTLPHGRQQYPRAVNDRVQIVGNYFNKFALDPYSRAFLCQNGETIDLNEAIDPALNLRLYDAMDVNEHGIILCRAVSTTPGNQTPVNGVLLLPVEFKARDGRINYGFDPPMKGIPTANPPVPDDLASEPPWASVIKGQSSDNVAFKIAQSFAPFTKLAITLGDQFLHLSPKDTALSEAETTLTLAGLSLTIGSVNAEVEAQTVNDSQKLASLRVMVLPERTVSVGIYRVEDPDSAGTMPVGGPTDAEIINELKDIFKQAGVTFRLDGSGNRNIAYDKIRDGIRDGKVQGDEIDLIVDTLRAANEPGTVYIILTKDSGMPYPTDPTKFVRGATSVDDSFSLLFVDTILAAGGDVTLIEAHEMGHILNLASRNPDDGGHDPGPFPLGTDGLMKSGSPDPVTGALPPNPGRWLPHEDWKTANEEANQLQ